MLYDAILISLRPNVTHRSTTHDTTNLIQSKEGPVHGENVHSTFDPKAEGSRLYLVHPRAEICVPRRPDAARGDAVAVEERRSLSHGETLQARGGADQHSRKPGVFAEMLFHRFKRGY